LLAAADGCASVGQGVFVIVGAYPIEIDDRAVVRDDAILAVRRLGQLQGELPVGLRLSFEPQLGEEMLADDRGFKAVPSVGPEEHGRAMSPKLLESPAVELQRLDRLGTVVVANDKMGPRRDSYGETDSRPALGGGGEIALR
jgi:hypothetical protein